MRFLDHRLTRRHKTVDDPHIKSFKKTVDDVRILLRHEDNWTNVRLKEGFRRRLKLSLSLFFLFLSFLSFMFYVSRLEV